MKYILSFFTVLLFSIEVTAQSSVPDWSHIPKSETFDVVSWNILFFGREDRGPSDLQKQWDNVKEVIDTLNADIIGFQEVYNNQMFADLVESLERYDGVISSYSSPMDVAFIYNNSTVEYLGHRLVDEEFGIDRSNIVNRTLLEFEFQVTTESVTDTMYAAVYHAQHGSNRDAYDLRTNASSQIKAYFDEHRKDKPLFFLGDYNDDVVYNIMRSYPTPYTPYYNFITDDFYHVVSRSLSEAGDLSHSSGMIDHIMINGHLDNLWLKGSESIHTPDYIEEFENTTSDHYPVSARFDLTGSTENEEVPNPEPGGGEAGEDIPRSETFDVATWNIEWFGNVYWGPLDVDKQYENVVKVISDLESDLITLQEVQNLERLVQLLGDIEGYSAIIADYTETSMEVVFLYNSETVEYLGRKLINEEYGMARDYVYRRPPVEFKFRVQSEATVDTIYAIGYHAFEGTSKRAYEFRSNASAIIKNYLDEYRHDKPVIVLGTYNDTVIEDSGPNYPHPYTPYHNFMEDPFYTVLTKSLNESGKSSHSRGMVDHIMINDHLNDFWHQESEQVYNAYYIDDFLNTTSDHLPVTARFDFKSEIKTNNATERNRQLPEDHKILGNYPNPFNPATNIIFEIPKHDEVTLEVFNLLGQKVRVVELGLQQPGRQELTLKAGGLASGNYLLRIRMGNEIRTHTFTIIK